MNNMNNNTSRKVTIGNFYDSRVGDHSYTMWTTGADYCIEEAPDKRYYYRVRTFWDAVVTKIDATALENSRVIPWEEVNTAVKAYHFEALFPNGTESEKNLFVYGDEKGRQINAENEWADAHKVYSRDVTLQLKAELGQFSTVRFLREVVYAPGTGYRAYIYVVDEKWQVTVDAGEYDSRTGKFYASHKVEDYTKVVASEKAFGRRASRMAKAAEVPWEIAVFVGHIASDEEAVSILKQVKSARGTADERLQWELKCGIGRRTAAIEALLGETWGKLNCRGQRQTTTLANYLLGE